MNLKTTVILLVCAVSAGLGWAAFFLIRAVGPNKPPAIFAPEVQKALEQDSSDVPLRIVLASGDQRVELERAAGKTEWTMPGNWPTRTDEVKQLLRLLAGLESRFVPIPITSKTEKTYGVDRPAVSVTLRAGDKKQELKFGRQTKNAPQNDDDEEDGNSFYRPTYVRLDDNNEVIRLAPGLVDSLKRSPDYFQQRWLFLPPQLKLNDGKTPAKGKEVQPVKSISVTDNAGGAANRYTLTWTDGAWLLTQPVRDRVDPDKVKSILEAVPDIWAESFVEKPKKDLAEYGLKEPEQIIRVTKANGQTVTVLVGKQSQVKRRIIMRQGPSQFGQPPRPMPQQITEEYRYAKLQDNKAALRQIFEIKAARLKDLTSSAAMLRDPKLARFTTDDVQKLEVDWKGKQIVLEKKDFTWNMVKPVKQEAETTKVTELLDKLAALEAKDNDVIDKTGKTDLKKYGLEKPEGTIKVTVEEKDKGKSKSKKSKVFRFALGKHDATTSKLYVRVHGWDRINAVEDSLFKLAARPALAYRGKQVLKFSASDLAKIEVKSGKDPFTLEQVKDKWRLAAPVQAEVDTSKADQLAGDLATLDAADFVAENAKPDELKKRFGLDKSALSAKLTFKDKKKKAETLTIGNKLPGKPQYYAKLDSSPGIFAVKKDLHDSLEKSSLTYRPVQLWQMQADDIQALGIRKEEPGYRLKRDGQNWQITSPFQAAANAETARPMADELAKLGCERYVAHAAKSLSEYGLDKPYLRVVLTPVVKKDKKDDKKKDKKDDTKKEDSKKEDKERVLLVGKLVEKSKKERFAKLGDSEAIFVLGDKVVTALDHGVLDLLDRALLTLDTKNIQRIREAGGKSPLALERKGEEWRVVAAPAAPFTADREVVDALLDTWSNLRAERFAAYGPKVDVKDYGLDSPSSTMTVILQPEDKKKKGKEHTLALGSAVKEGKGERYARLDSGPGVVVLNADAVRRLTPGYLDFIKREVWKLDAAGVTGLQRREGKRSLELAKNKDGWHLLKPAKFPADKNSVDRLLEQLAPLRAKGVAEYPAKNLKKFGLDDPDLVVTVTVSGADNKTVEHVLKIGEVQDKDSGDRYAITDKPTAVFILPGALVNSLTAKPIYFRDRTLPHLADADRIELQRGRRKAVFARLDGVWKMTEPLEVDAEQTALEDFLKALGKLRADELVADKPSKLKPYGLDRPEVAWRFYSGDKEVMGLLVGSAEKDKKTDKGAVRHYAKLAGGDLVFLLDPDLSTKALDEYRTRKVWTLDAAQIEEIRYEYPKRSFTLKKVEDKWQVTGMPDAMVNADKIRDTLDALAGLKAERYVVDKGAALALYGLKKPELVLEIKTKSGKQVLHIGRQEGDSKRYYARVVEGDNAAVFVISEADGGKIVRTLKEFTQAAGK